jgi:hypothetical protein
MTVHVNPRERREIETDRRRKERREDNRKIQSDQRWVSE